MTAKREAAASGEAENAIVELHDVNKWYGEFHALRDVNLTVGRREKVVVCGPSGSGKVNHDPLYKPAGGAPGRRHHRGWYGTGAGCTQDRGYPPPGRHGFSKASTCFLI